MNRIYVVEDNKLIREAVCEYFQVNGFEVVEFDRAAGVLEGLRVSEPDAIILDIMLPDKSGYILAKEIRKYSTVPILFLTAREEESSRVMGFEIGGDDYIVKPFSTKELLLRTQAVLKRAGTQSQSEQEQGTWYHNGHELHVDQRKRKAFHDGQELYLTNAEWTILSYLAFREGRAISRQHILGECLGYHFEGSERTVDTHIANIRDRLGKSGWIETVRGYGYRFVSEGSEQPE
ncbi:MAG: response regulator transcription factor [Spirochaetota bacterium]